MTSHLATVQSDAVVVSLMRASTALAEAKTIQQTKKIMDVAAAAEIYARRQHLGDEAEALAVSIKVEALRKLGLLGKNASSIRWLARFPDAFELTPPAKPNKPSNSSAKTNWPNTSANGRWTGPCPSTKPTPWRPCPHRTHSPRTVGKTPTPWPPASRPPSRR